MWSFPNHTFYQKSGVGVALHVLLLDEHFRDFALHIISNFLFFLNDFILSALNFFCITRLAKGEEERENVRKKGTFVLKWIHFRTLKRAFSQNTCAS